MTQQYDFEKIFELLDKMELCVNKVRHLNHQLNKGLNTIPKAA
ncbi:hypothetical protein BDD26_3518 [Xenorhabdus cabanillasii]|uniref:Uncharacterized protein n=1 Tax=Xenorhabdus cabanillasii TaxID=351673 RepID=A0A3D9UJJ4_9GAMM|nr:hypothetical protein [Xenorhabdus cabanillasii]REF28583.1 hypothetical protein BDD26_3518 [Xenorhabdus cabanillasii]